MHHTEGGKEGTGVRCGAVSRFVGCVPASSQPGRRAGQHVTLVDRIRQARRTHSECKCCVSQSEVGVRGAGVPGMLGRAQSDDCRDVAVAGGSRSRPL